MSINTLSYHDLGKFSENLADFADFYRHFLAARPIKATNDLVSW